MSEICSHCGANMKKFWHKITPILVDCLVEVRTKVVEQNENKVYKRDLNLSHSEYGNFQKLRFHALIAKYKENDVWIRGYWVLTRRGAQFLNGEIQIPKSVQTFRNVVVGHSEDVVRLKDVLADTTYVETIYDIKTEDPTEEDIAKVIKRKKHKKGKTYCPKCDDEMKVRLDTFENEDGTLKVQKVYVCVACGHENAS